MDFEDFKPGENFVRHLIAGATAGTVEHCGLFPIDTIKTNMQPGSTFGKIGIYKTTQIIIERYGFFGLFRGISVVAAGAAPAHAMHFATYEFCKDKFGGNQPGHHPFSSSTAGIFATVSVHN